MSHGHSTHVTSSDSGSGAQTEAELSDPCHGSIKFGQEHAKNVLTAGFKSCAEDHERLAIIEKAQAVVLKMIRAEMSYNIKCQQIGVVMEELQTDRLTDETILNDVAMIDEAVLKKAAVLEKDLTQDKLKEHAHYKNLLGLIEQLETERHIPAVDASVVVAEVETPSDQPTEEIIPTTDPITKLSLTDPVRNKHCSHIYGKSAILELIRKNPHIRCPTIGCNNRNYIKKSDLVYDPVLAAKINMKQREMAKKKLKQQQEEQRHRSPRHRSPRHQHQSPK